MSVDAGTPMNRRRLTTLVVTGFGFLASDHARQQYIDALRQVVEMLKGLYPNYNPDKLSIESIPSHTTSPGRPRGLQHPDISTVDGDQPIEAERIGGGRVTTRPVSPLREVTTVVSHQRHDPRQTTRPVETRPSSDVTGAVANPGRYDDGANDNPGDPGKRDPGDDDDDDEAHTYVEDDGLDVVGSGENDQDNDGDDDDDNDNDNDNDDVDVDGIISNGKDGNEVHNEDNNDNDNDEDDGENDVDVADDEDEPARWDHRSTVGNNRTPSRSPPALSVVKVAISKEYGISKTQSQKQAFLADIAALHFPIRKNNKPVTGTLDLTRAAALTDYLFDTLMGPLALSQLSKLLGQYEKLSGQQSSYKASVRAAVLAQDPDVPTALRNFYKAYNDIGSVKEVELTAVRNFQQIRKGISLLEQYENVKSLFTSDLTLKKYAIRYLEAKGVVPHKRPATLAHVYLTTSLNITATELRGTCERLAGVAVMVNVFGGGIIPLLPIGIINKTRDIGVQRLRSIVPKLHQHMPALKAICDVLDVLVYKPMLAGDSLPISAHDIVKAPDSSFLGVLQDVSPAAVQGRIIQEVETDTELRTPAQDDTSVGDQDFGPDPDTPIAPRTSKRRRGSTLGHDSAARGSGVVVSRLNGARSSKRRRKS